MSWILQKIHSRLHEKNQNWICVICGPTGSGKSYSALRLGELIDPNFNIDRCCFGAEEFLTLINNGNLKTGSCIILDEAGVGIPARQWYDICNKAVNFVLQTFRRENIALIMTTPALSFLDVQARILSHSYVDTQKIDRKRKQVRVKFMEVQFNPKYGKIYYKYYRKGREALTKTWINKPSKGIIKEYEKKKKQFSRRLYHDALQDAKKIEVKKLTTQEIAETILKNYEEYMKEHGGRKIVNSARVEAEFGVGTSISKRVKYLVESTLKKEGKI